MKYYLTLLSILSVSAVLASPPDYRSTMDEIETEKKDRTERVREKLPFSNVPFANDVTTDDVTQGQETGQYSTAQSRQEGEPALQERFRARTAQYIEARLMDLEAFEQDMTKQADVLSRQALEIVDQLDAKHEALIGPKASKADPAFAKDSSNTLNPSPHSSQQGDPCQSAEGNSASMAVAPVASQYDNACEGKSFAEHNDCTQGAVKESNSESKGISANSTQVFEPIKPKIYDETQNIGQAYYAATTLPSCPTEPRLAESKMENIASLVSSRRSKFEQSDLVSSASSSAFTVLPIRKVVVQQALLPWYKNFFAWVLPNAFAKTTTLRGRTNNTGRANELAAQNRAKFLSELNNYSDMAGEQMFAKEMSTMFDAQNEINRNKLELIKQTSANLDKLANVKHIEF